jgi:hypothetical protein
MVKGEEEGMEGGVLQSDWEKMQPTNIGQYGDCLLEYTRAEKQDSNSGLQRDFERNRHTGGCRNMDIGI